jgi:lipopolysaccharide export LptBFGC system permease protein LptF
MSNGRMNSVKKLLALTVAIAFAAGTAGFALAQTAAPPAEKKADDKAEKKADDKMEKKAEKKMPTKSASGTVKSAGADSVVVSGKEKGKEAEWTFAVDSKTSIKKGGKAVTAGDIKAGDSVSVKYHEMDGKATASAITVRSGSMAKKEESKKEEKK